MPKYDAAQYDPPAPVATVNLQSSTGGPLVRDVVLLMDTGADITILPRVAAQRIGTAPVAAAQYEIIGIDGASRSTMDAVDLDMHFLNKSFRGRYLLTDLEHGVLGRDVLNSLRLVLDGPNHDWNAV